MKPNALIQQAIEIVGEDGFCFISGLSNEALWEILVAHEAHEPLLQLSRELIAKHHELL